MGLFSDLEDDIKNLPKKVILNNSNYKNDRIDESYELYNKAIDMINNNCFTSARKLLESAFLINNNDNDIIIATGLLNVLFCDFDESCKCFYRINKNISNNLCDKYIKILISEEFKCFLEYYNLGIIKVNEQKHNEAIEIFLNIADKESSLIEPYITLYSIYKHIEDNTKKNECINLIKVLDKDNEILHDIYIEMDINKNSNENLRISINHKNKKMIIGMILLLIIPIISYMYIRPKFNENIVNKENETIAYTEDNQSENEKIDTDKIENENIEDDEELDQEENIDLSYISEEELIKKANDFKKNKNYKIAINIYKDIVRLSKSSDIVSEAIYQIAVLNEKIKNYEESIKYYNQYIENYSTSYPYYDESYYNIAMIYYNINDLEKSKEYISELIIKDPESIYNNSEVKKILGD